MDDQRLRERLVIGSLRRRRPYAPHADNRPPPGAPSPSAPPPAPAPAGAAGFYGDPRLAAQQSVGYNPWSPAPVMVPLAPQQAYMVPGPALPQVYQPPVVYQQPPQQILQHPAGVGAMDQSGLIVQHQLDLAPPAERKLTRLVEKLKGKGTMLIVMLILGLAGGFTIAKLVEYIRKTQPK